MVSRAALACDRSTRRRRSSDDQYLEIWPGIRVQIQPRMIMHMTSNANCLPLGPLSDLGGFERVAAHVNRAQILTSTTTLDASPSQAAGGARWAIRSRCTIIRRGSLALSLKSTTAHRLLSRVVHNAPDSTWAVHELEDVLAAEASICFTCRGGGAVLHQPQTRCCSMFIPS